MTSSSLPAIPSANDPFVERLAANLREHIQNELDQSLTVVVAVSGGPDSCALLAATAALAMCSKALTVSACHINHALRGDESEADEHFCRRLCDAWSIPIGVERLPGNISDEARMREARYAALSAYAERTRARWILTAHNCDDQVETVLFRLFRGSSTRGLLGIPEFRNLGQNLAIVRPMLNIPRKDVSEFLKRNGLPSREDSSNLSMRYGRNYIRHKVIPPIAQQFPQFGLSIERFCRLLDEEQTLLTQLAATALAQVQISEHQWSLSRLLEQPVTIKRRSIGEALRARRIEVGFDRVEAVLQLTLQGQGALSLNQFWDVRAESGILTWQFKPDYERTPEVAGETLVVVPGLTMAPALGVGLETEPVDDLPSDGYPGSSAHEAVVDLARVVQPLVVRIRQPGDVIQPIGMAVKVKLKKYLHTHESADKLNPLATVVVSDAQEVVWVPGVGLSEKIKVTSKPSHYWRFFCMDTDVSCPEW